MRVVGSFVLRDNADTEYSIARGAKETEVRAVPSRGFIKEIKRAFRKMTLFSVLCIVLTHLIRRLPLSPHFTDEKSVAAKCNWQNRLEPGVRILKHLIYFRKGNTGG